MLDRGTTADSAMLRARARRDRRARAGAHGIDRGSRCLCSRRRAQQLTRRAPLIVLRFSWTPTQTRARHLKNRFPQINTYSETTKCACIRNPAWQQELLPWSLSYLEEAMKTLALGLAAALGLAVPAIADTSARNVQLAQASKDGGAQSGGGAAATQQSGGGAATTQRGGREGGARSGDNAQSSGSAGTNRQAEGRREGSRTNIRANVRIGGDGDRVRSRTTTTQRFGVRSRVGSSDDVVIQRKKARRYVYNAPSSVTIKKKKKVRHYVSDEPSSTTIVRKRRPGVSVGVGVSTRTSVRERTGVREGASVNIRGSSTTKSSTTTRSSTGGSVSGGTNAQSTTSGQSGASGGMQTRGTSGSGGQTRGTSGSGGGELSGTKQ